MNFDAKPCILIYRTVGPSNCGASKRRDGVPNGKDDDTKVDKPGNQTY